jgi:aminoglycoside 6-adenylyltransferase
VKRWAETEPSVRAVIVVGSRARINPAADAWSDLDLIAFVTDPRPLVSSAAWFERFGEVWMAYLANTGAGDPEWFVLFAGGVKLDVAVHVLPPALQSAAVARILAAGTYADVVGRGARVLLDKNAPGEPEQALTAAPASLEQPSEVAFQTVIRRAFFTAINVAKFLRRGDLWRAKQRCDCELKRDLLAVLEWQALAYGGGQADVWFEGRSIAAWCDPALYARVPQTFARYAEEDLRRALFASLDLFRQAASQAGGAWGYRYPEELDTKIDALLRSILAG